MNPERKIEVVLLQQVVTNTSQVQWEVSSVLILTQTNRMYLATSQT